MVVLGGEGGGIRPKEGVRQGKTISLGYVVSGQSKCGVFWGIGKEMWWASQISTSTASQSVSNSPQIWYQCLSIYIITLLRDSIWTKLLDGGGIGFWDQLTNLTIQLHHKWSYQQELGKPSAWPGCRQAGARSRYSQFNWLSQSLSDILWGFDPKLSQLNFYEYSAHIPRLTDSS